MAGKLSDDKYSWVFPTVSVEKKNGGLIHTTIYAGVMNGKCNSDIIANHMNPMVKGVPNPNFNSDFKISNVAAKIEESMLNGHPITGVGFYVTEHHHDGSPVSFGVISFVETGKNLKRKNCTNVLTQAIKDATSLYNRKNKEGNNKTSGVVLPMLAQGESLSANEDIIKEYISDNLTLNGLYCQPKLDGVRCLATLNPKFHANKVAVNFETSDEVICYSRKGTKIFVSQHILEELREILVPMQKKLGTETLVLDGESYLHGQEFSLISGSARGSEFTDFKNKIDYIVYDYYDGNNTSYANRNKFLNENRDLFDEAAVHTDINAELSLEDLSGHAKLIDTKHFTSADDIYDYYIATIADSYEGIMLRTPSGVYEKGSRSKNLVKIKPMISREYKCIGYEFGTGKDANIPTLICEIGKKGIVWGNDWRRSKDENVNESTRPGLTFKVKLKGMTMEEQKNLGLEFQQICPNGNTVFENKYKNRKVTIEFYSYSNECKPEKANCKGFL